jgi:hypothetical protein
VASHAALHLLNAEQKIGRQAMKYFVEGLTNVHGGESNVRRIGEYETLEDAIRASEHVIDEFLIARIGNAMTAADLFVQYQKFCEVPFIFCDDAKTINVTGFNHFKYAMTRCSTLCARAQSEPAG